jgi:hypothetical protein
MRWVVRIEREDDGSESDVIRIERSQSPCSLSCRTCSNRQIDDRAAVRWPRAGSGRDEIDRRIGGPVARLSGGRADVTPFLCQSRRSISRHFVSN